jgi:hypothetical protein
VIYRLIGGSHAVLRLRPYVKFRRLNTRVDVPLDEPCLLSVAGERYELHGTPEFPPLRLRVPHAAAFTVERAAGEMRHTASSLYKR